MKITIIQHDHAQPPSHYNHTITISTFGNLYNEKISRKFYLEYGNAATDKRIT
jgi:hypothetical protein